MLKKIKAPALPLFLIDAFSAVQLKAGQHLIVVPTYVASKAKFL